MSSQSDRKLLAALVLITLIVHVRSQQQNNSSLVHLPSLLEANAEHYHQLEDQSLFTLRNLSDILISDDFNPMVKTIANQLMGMLDEILNLNQLDTNDFEETELDEKLIFLTTSTNGTAIISFSGLVYTVLWVIAMGVVGSMVVCYWVGCEYEEATTQTSTTNSYGRALTTLAKYVIIIYG